VLAVGYAMAAGLLAILTMLLAVSASLPPVVISFAAFNVAVSATRPAHYAAVPQLTTSPAVLVRTNSATSLVVGIGGFVGPALAGLVATWGLPWLGASIGAVALAVGAVVCVGLGLPAPGAGDDDSPEEHLGVVAGLRQVAVDRPVMALLLLSGLTYLVVSTLEILNVTFSASDLGADAAGQGLLVGAPAIGGIIGALLGAGLAYWRRLGPPFVVGVALSGLLTAAMALAPTLGVGVVVMVLVGIFGTIGALASETLVQRAVDDAALLRVMAVWESLMLLAYGLGGLVAPVLVAWLGAPAAYVSVGLAMAAFTVLARPLLKPLDDRAVFRTDVLARLRGVGFLSGLPPAGLDRIARSAEWVEVEPSLTVIVEGEPGDAYYVVDEGSVAVRQGGADLATLGPGDGFGEIALLFDRPRTATVVTREHTRLLRVQRSDFLAAVTRSPDGHAVAVGVAAAQLERDRESHDAPPD
jgi:hypothetical protein